MRRREFLVAAGITAAVSGRFAFAQAADRLPVLGLLWVNSAEAEARIGLVAEAHAGLADLGYVEGKTIRIEERFGDGTRKRAEELAAELVGLHVDLIVTGAEGSPAAALATRTIPIVTCVSADPVAEGLAASLAHPGGNLTGNAVFFPEIMAKRLEQLKQSVPSMTRAGVLTPPADSLSRYTVEVMAKAAKPLGVELRLVEASDAASYEQAFATASAAGIGGFVVLDPPLFFRDFAVIGQFARQYRQPTAGAPLLARMGGLIGYGVLFHALFRNAAVFVDKILRGAKPGDIPIQQATKFETVVNLKTAHALGLEMPPTLLAAADAVIE